MTIRMFIAVAAGTAAFAAPASASTIVGETPGPEAEVHECSPIEGVEDGSGDGAPSYTVPGDGVITSFRHVASAAVLGDQFIRMKVWQRGEGLNQFEVAGASEIERLAPGALNEFATRVPVAAGEMLGITTLTMGMDCAFTGVSGDHHLYTDRQDTPAGGTTYLPIPMSGYRWNIEATVEPDLDADGFGDETQDGCPERRGFHGPCPPETMIVSGPEALRSTRARFRFRSSLPRSRFTCRMDKRRPRPCASPIVYSDLTSKRHTFRVFATIRGGVSDPTPAKAEVRPPR